MLLQAFYSVRSKRQLMVQLDCSLLFRWFVGLGFDDPVRDASTFSTNHDRLLDGSVKGGLLKRRAGDPARGAAAVAGLFQR